MVELQDRCVARPIRHVPSLRNGPDASSAGLWLARAYRQSARILDAHAACGNLVDHHRDLCWRGIRASRVSRTLEEPCVHARTCRRVSFRAHVGSRTPTFFHSEHRQLPWCRELWPAPRVEINPEDAERLGIEPRAIGCGSKAPRAKCARSPICTMA